MSQNDDVVLTVKAALKNLEVASSLSDGSALFSQAKASALREALKAPPGPSYDGDTIVVSTKFTTLVSVHSSDVEIDELDRPREIRRALGGDESKLGGESDDPDSTDNTDDELVGHASASENRSRVASTEGTGKCHEKAFSRSSQIDLLYMIKWWDTHQRPRIGAEWQEQEEGEEKERSQAGRESKARVRIHGGDGGKSGDESRVVEIQDTNSQITAQDSNLHPVLAHSQLVRIMRDAIKNPRKPTLGELDSDVWIKHNGNLKLKYQYLLRLPATSNAADTLTEEEKQCFISGSLGAFYASNHGIASSGDAVVACQLKAKLRGNSMGDEAVEYLWVGLSPETAHAFVKSRQVKKALRPSKGNGKDRDAETGTQSNIVVAADDPHALRIVVPTTEAPVVQARFYAIGSYETIVYEDL
ncbi:MAG: hypothetical protein M1816_007914 [Peltula sp. TS41687]|nr:MAG: hypothetical protein M1816_007914 [Peltula sp. TS41687]